MKLFVNDCSSLKSWKEEVVAINILCIFSSSIIFLLNLAIHYLGTMYNEYL